MWWVKTKWLMLLLAAALPVGCMGKQAREPSPDARYRPATYADVEVLSTFNKAVLAAADGHYPEAVSLFEEASRQFKLQGDLARAAEAVFWIGYCYEKQSRPTEAAKFYRRVMETYPNTRASRQAQERQRVSQSPPTPPDQR